MKDFLKCILVMMMVMGCPGVQASPGILEKIPDGISFSRIACLVQYPAEILCDMGAADRIVAICKRDKGDLYYAQLKDKPMAGGGYGRNIYSIDPRKIPTRAAHDVGVKLADEILNKHFGEFNTYPEKIGMVFWSLDAYRADGEQLAQILRLMGARPAWNESGIVTGIEVIPLDELKRPRIDVTIRTSEIVRDTLPNLIELMDEAVVMIAALDEDESDNCILLMMALMICPPALANGPAEMEITDARGQAIRIKTPVRRMAILPSDALEVSRLCPISSRLYPLGLIWCWPMGGGPAVNWKINCCLWEFRWCASIFINHPPNCERFVIWGACWTDLPRPKPMHPGMMILWTGLKAGCAINAAGPRSIWRAIPITMPADPVPAAMKWVVWPVVI